MSDMPPVTDTREQIACLVAKLYLLLWRTAVQMKPHNSNRADYVNWLADDMHKAVDIALRVISSHLREFKTE